MYPAIIILHKVFFFKLWSMDKNKKMDTQNINVLSENGALNEKYDHFMGTKGVIYDNI